MKNLSLCLSLALIATPLANSHRAMAQSDSRPEANPASAFSGPSSTTGSSSSSSSASSETAAEPSYRGIMTVPPAAVHHTRPFSEIALGAGFSPLGVGMQLTTNVAPHFNLRGTGNLFNYSVSGISTQGFNVSGKVNMASAGLSVDYYPFHNGFRLSPGALLYNGNQASTTFVAMPGASFSLDDHTYYSATGANAVHGLGTFGLGNGSPAFTMTTGWGNTIPHSSRRISFPFEIGAAFIQRPTASLVLSGLVCDGNGQNCANVATDPTAQADLAKQVQKYQNDIDVLKVYPIVSFGVAYNIGRRGWQGYAR